MSGMKNLTIIVWLMLYFKFHPLILTKSNDRLRKKKRNNPSKTKKIKRNIPAKSKKKKSKK